MRRAISSFAALGAVLLMTVPAQANGAGAVSITQTFHNATMFVAASPNPCTGVPGDLTLTYNGVAHMTVLTSGVGAGTGWGTFTATGALNVVQVDGVIYTGHFTTWDGFNFNLQNFTGTGTFSLHATGTDGSTLRYHEVMHITALLGPTPTIIVSFDKPTCG
jgi:hypothetical protein